MGLEGYSGIGLVYLTSNCTGFFYIVLSLPLNCFAHRVSVGHISRFTRFWGTTLTVYSVWKKHASTSRHVYSVSICVLERITAAGA